MQGYTLSGQGLRAYKVNGPWLKQVWSCSRMRKPKWSCLAKAAAVVLWIYFLWKRELHLQTITKGRKSTNTLWRRIAYQTEGATWAAEVFEAELPYQQLHPLVSHSCLALLNLFRYGLRKPAPYVAFRWPGRRGGHRQKHVCGLFVMRLLILLLPTGCMPRPMHWKSFQVTDHDRLSLGSFVCPEVALLPSHTTMWNWGHIARAAVEGILEIDGRDEAWQDWKTYFIL